MATNIFGGAPNPAGAVSSFAGAAQDIFAGFGDQARAAGDIAEQQSYLLAAKCADIEARYTKESTAIQSFQQQREVTKSLGSTVAGVAGAGFAASGSSMDILRESASQGALANAVLKQQGLIQEAGYKEQAASYLNMAAAEGQAASAEKMAATGSDITAGLRIATGIAMLPLGA
jgi:hypothetical protein